MSGDPLIKVNMLRSSLKCLACGLISLVALAGLPFVIMAMASKGDDTGFHGFCLFISVLSLAGFPFALTAIFASRRVRVAERKFWNAARPHRIVGKVCALLAFIAAVVVGIVSVFLILNRTMFGNAY